MPKRSKKLLVYLDQNFIGEMAKANINKKVKQEWKDLSQLLKEGFLYEKLVAPKAWFHDVETSFAPVLKARIVSYQNYLGQVGHLCLRPAQPEREGECVQVFFELGAAARQFGAGDYAEIYAFDDGRSRKRSSANGTRPAVRYGNPAAAGLKYSQ